MAQQLNYLEIPQTESELRGLLDKMYSMTLEARQKDHPPRFKGLLEIISSDTVILSAVHNVKANRGSETPGSDGETTRNNILEEMNFQEVISRVKDSLNDYQPSPVRRVYIPKPGKAEKRPLGIPTVCSYCTSFQRGFRNSFSWAALMAALTTPQRFVWQGRQ